MKKGLNTYWKNMAKCLLIVLMSSFVLTSCVEKDVDVTSVTLDKTTLELTIGGTATLNATVLPSDATDKTVVWTSSNPSVATVSDGLVTAVGAGTATITATAGGKSATCTVAVETPVVVVTSVTLDNPTLDLNIGESSTLVATVAPDNATDKTVTWTTSDATIATVNNGVVSALAAGTATITATSGTQTATCDVTVSTSVAINDTTFPDEAFRAYLYNKFDADKDSLFSESEIANATNISIGSTAVTDMSGLEYFTQLTRLTCHSLNLSSLDVSSNTNLTSLYCYNNNLTSLDLSNNTQLTELYCYENQITSLDLSNNTALTNLNCSLNSLSGLDLSNNTQLTVVRCFSNNLTSLDVSGCTLLVDLYCHDNNLSTLDVSDNVLLATFNCSNNAFEAINIDNNTVLDRFYCADNNLSTLDVSNNTALRLLSCSSNNLETLDVDANTMLTFLYCDGNNLTELDISNTLVSTTAGATANLGAQQNEGTITVTMTSTQSDIFNAAFAADEKNVGVVIDVLP